MKINYSQIQQIKLKRENGLVKGMLIGMGADLLTLQGRSPYRDKSGVCGCVYKPSYSSGWLGTGGIMGATACVTSKKGYYTRGASLNFMILKRK